MGKFFGILLGFLLVVLFVLLSWQINPEKTAPFLPPSIQKFLSADGIAPNLSKESTNPKKTTKIKKENLLKELPQQQTEELTNTSALLERGENFLQSGLFSLAINDFSRATELTPKSRQPWNKLAGAQIASRDLSGAQTSLNTALRYFPNDEGFLTLLGEVYLQQSKFAEAQKIFEKMPEGGTRYFYLGILAAHSGKFDEAKTFFLQAKKLGLEEKAQVFLNAFDQFELFPDGDPLYLRLLLAKAFDDLRFFELAIDSTKSILKERGDYRDAWIILGHSYLSLERFDLAKNVLDEALRFDPTKPETAFFLAMTEASMGAYDDAITHFSLARENGYVPQIEVTKALAEAYLNGGFYEVARKEFEKLVEIRTATVADYEKPIRISLEFLGDTATAQTLAMRAVELYPTSVEAKNLLAWAFLEGEQYAQAQVLLEEILSQNPENTQAHIYMGDYFLAQKEKEKALESYKKAYELSSHTQLGIEAAKKYNMLLLEE